MSVKIFLEGRTDIKFCTDYVKHILNLDLSDSDFIDFKGKDNWRDNVELFKINTGQLRTNLVIFDADENFAERKQYCLNKKPEYDIEFELFLFPNNRDSGELEDLLCRIINPAHSQIFDCFEKYEVCLPKEYYPPDKKAKVYAYKEALHRKSKNENKSPEDKNSYLNTEHWDLNHSHLSPLKTFLEKAF